MSSSRYEVDRVELAALLDGEPGYRVDQVWHGLYTEQAPLEDLTALPKQLRTRLADLLPLALTEHVRTTSSDGGTTKWLWSLHDGRAIETVLMHYDRRSTVCVSTQAGCAMGCGFCATGQMGFDRQLTTGEIVEQVVRAQHEAVDRRVSNVVFMGMGEPLANFDRTWAAIERLHADLGLSARHLTVSTVGIAPGIDRLAGASLPVGLAVSLHAANDELRDELVPINRRYPLDLLEASCRRYRERTGRRVSLEWALIDGVNDRRSDAVELAGFAGRLRAHVNLIPLNPTDGYETKGSPMRHVRRFAGWLDEDRINVTVRRTRGTDIDAACGQLRVRSASTPVTLQR